MPGSSHLGASPRRCSWRLRQATTCDDAGGRQWASLQVAYLLAASAVLGTARSVFRPSLEALLPVLRYVRATVMFGRLDRGEVRAKP
jgi:hypothetical protein